MSKLTLREARASLQSNELAESMLRMHTAAFQAINETDVADIMKAIVTKAKGGCARSAQFIMDYLGGGPPKIKVTINQNTDSPKPASRGRVVIQHKSEEAELRADEADSQKKPTVRDIRRHVGMYLARNGPTPPGELAKLFEFADCEDTVFCNWFATEMNGDWRLSEIGRAALGKK